jgi:hypothetical protein
MKNLFDYLTEIYNSNEKYRKNYDLEDFIQWFIVESFGINMSIHEGFLYDDDETGLICRFKPDVKIDMETKTLEILVEDYKGK